MQTSLIIAGHVYNHGTTEAISSVNVAVKNLTTQESHDGEDTGFQDLTTNINGEFLCNLANYSEEYTSGDVIQLTINHNGLKDYVRVTIGTTSISTLILTPLPREVFDFERSLDKIADIIRIYTQTSTLDEDYGSMSTNPSTLKAVDDIYASIQIDTDEISLEDQGSVAHGEATGFFKIRYNISKDDRIEYPRDSGNFWNVYDKPKRRTFKNSAHHDEAHLVKVI